MKNYEPKQLVAISRYQNYFPSLPAEIREDVYARMRELIEEEKAYCDKGNYKHMAQILTSIALYEVLQRHGKSEEEAYRIVSEEMWKFLNPSGMESLKALRNKLDLGRIRYVFTSHNGFTDDPKSAFRHIDTPPTLKKGRPFDETAPYDCFAEKEE